MTSTRAVHLAEVLDVFDRDRFSIGQITGFVCFGNFSKVQHGIQQHRRVAAGENKTIAPHPVGLSRIVVHVVVPQLVR